MNGTHSVCLVGAGYISDIHAEVLTAIPGLRVGAIVDINQAAAKALAARRGAAQCFSTVEEAIASGQIDRAHILAPPHLHQQLALPLIAARIPTLIEKPICVSTNEASELLAAIAAAKTPVGVNQNFVYHPAVKRMADLLKQNRYGRLHYVHCLYNVPLRQLASGQLGHWMFQQPGNILLEQAVHPLSQIAAIAGDIQAHMAVAGQDFEIAPGVPFYGTLQVDLKCARAPAQLRFAVGQNFPFWQLSAVCDDGVIVADILSNRVYVHTRTRWLDAVDQALSGMRSAAAMAAQSGLGLINYTLSMARLKPRSDPFYQSMAASIGEFHAAVSTQAPIRCDAAFGAKLVQVCEEISTKLFKHATAGKTHLVETAAGCDVAVLGGTGFIGRHTVAQLVARGKKVAVMARTVRNLPAIYQHPQVAIVQGDVRSEDDVKRAIGDAPIVVNLAHGGGGGSWAAIEAAVVGSARAVANACLDRGVKRLVHIGSVAALYLGDENEVITGATPPDSEPEKRADYGRAKGDADRYLLQQHREKNLPVCILRPGVVVGEGSPPFHSGIGFFNNDQHCLGWNGGRNAIPFVLAEDVAQAIVAATDAPGIEGKCFNLVGGVRMTAREYISELSGATGRRLFFHAQHPLKLQGVEIGKWLVKTAAGQKVAFPSYRDLLSRGMKARFDCGDAERDLNWRPVTDRDEFIRRAIAIFAPPPV